MRFFSIFCVFLLSATAPLWAAEITIGVAGPMTGGLAAFGEQIEHGAEIGAEAINASGGLLSQKVSVISEDDACDPKQARLVANKIAALKPAIVFGHWCSGPSMAASGVYGEEGILQMDVGGLLVKLTQQGYPTIFRMSATSRSYAAAFVAYTRKHNPNARVAIISDQPAVTKEAAQQLKELFNGTTNTVVAMEDIQGGEKDFSTVIDRLKVARPDVVIFTGYTIEAGLLARQFAEKKLDVFYYSWDTMNSPDFLSIIADTDTKKIVSIDYARAPESVALEALSQKLRARHWPVETTTILTYAAFQIFTEAVNETKSTDPVKVAAAFHNHTFDTVLGPVTFDAGGDRVDPAFAAYQWVGGKLTNEGNVP